MPGFTCCVPRCHSNNKKDRYLKFYDFPTERKLCCLWIKNINRRGNVGKYSLFKPTKAHPICRIHFEGGKKTYLMKIPTIFPMKPVKTITPRRPLVRRRDSGIESEVDDNDNSNNDNDDETAIKSQDILNDHSYSVGTNNSMQTSFWT